MTGRRRLTVGVLESILSAIHVALASIVPGECGDVPEEDGAKLEAAKQWATQQLEKRRANAQEKP